MASSDAPQAVRTYRPGVRCPAGWIDADGLLRVTLRREGAAVEATIRGGEPLTRACAGELEPELRTRGLIQ
jgi:hypothetical protein